MRVYTLQTGTLTIESIESINDGRVRGTCQGTAVGDGGTFFITDGRFDVPVTEVDLTQQR